MDHPSVLRNLLPVGLIVSVAIVLSTTTFAQERPNVSSEAGLFSLSLTTPACPPYPSPGQPSCPPPSPTPVPSAEAQKALSYIAQRKGIPTQALTVVAEHHTTFPISERKFRAVTILDTRSSGQFFKLLVDMNDGRVEEDLAALRDAEEKAYLQRYGRLQIALHNRLQGIGDDTMLPVAIWVASDTLRDDNEIQKSIAARFPAAQMASQRSGKLWDVEDLELARQIKAEYGRLATADTAQRIAPMIAHLKQQGIDVISYGALPSVAGWMTKRQILDSAKRSDVGMIYLIEERGKLEMNIAAATALAPTVWSRGITGANVRIAILEPGNIDPNVSCLNIVATRATTQGTSDHKTEISSVSACNHPTYRGLAPGATLVDAGFDAPDWLGSQPNSVTALQWAVDTQFAPIVNASIGWEADNQVNWTDRAFDYWARARFALISKSAGNTNGSNITSPGKGWNVLAVGGYDDKNTTRWEDDEMASFSARLNPASDHGDREKPEVVAPGRYIRTISAGNAIVEESGTSLAAPQVAGLGALLIHRNNLLSTWPEASRAIIMASATHNITGTANISPGQDLYDGAGAINALFADDAAQTRNYSSTDPCVGSCWWGEWTSNLAQGDYMYRYFRATAGERIRVAISWWSNADSPGNNYSFDRLDTDLDLGVHCCDGNYNLVPGAWSASWDNNYELVDFNVTQTGLYRIAVRKVMVYNNETTNYVGIALVKAMYKTYLPLVIR